jgi:hypothetical protein
MARTPARAPAVVCARDIVSGYRFGGPLGTSFTGSGFLGGTAGACRTQSPSLVTLCHRVHSTLHILISLSLSLSLSLYTLHIRDFAIHFRLPGSCCGLTHYAPLFALRSRTLRAFVWQPDLLMVVRYTYDCFQVRARILNPCVDVLSNQPHLAGLMYPSSSSSSSQFTDKM